MTPREMLHDIVQLHNSAAEEKALSLLKATLASAHLAGEAAGWEAMRKAAKKAAEEEGRHLREWAVAGAIADAIDALPPLDAPAQGEG